jgi:DNA-binding XRE family transcriptional regulator
MVLEALRAPEMDYSTLADTIGARRQTIVRLAEEGRAAARGQRE